MRVSYHYQNAWRLSAVRKLREKTSMFSSLSRGHLSQKLWARRHMRLKDIVNSAKEFGEQLLSYHDEVDYGEKLVASSYVAAFFGSEDVFLAREQMITP